MLIVNNTCCYIYKLYFVHTMNVWFVLFMKSRAITYMVSFNRHDALCLYR